MEKLNSKKETDLVLTAYGAADEVGRSAFIIEDGTFSILLEAGIKLRPKELSLAPVGLKERSTEIDVILLSHAHVDHSGYIPALYDNGYDGHIYLTDPTLEIVTLLWQDHLKIEGSRHWTTEGLEAAYNGTITTKFKEVITLAEGITVEFLPAGHILGAAMIYINWKGTKILFTGDINDQQTPLFEGFEMPDKEVDVLIIESTNGLREITPRQEVNKELIREIVTVLESGNKVIIPCFAIGRSQEVLCVITEAIKSYPIYVDGMINVMNNITEKYLTKEWVGEPLLERLKKEKRFSPFDYDNVFPITKVHYDNPHDFRKFLGRSDDPAIIVTTSGMMMPSPLHTHLLYASKNEHNLIAVTGYQAEGTLGKEILDGKRTVELHTSFKRTKSVTIRPKILKFGFSGHVSHEGIQDLISHVKPKKIIFMHGDPTNQQAISDQLENGIIPKLIKPKIPVILKEN